MNGAWIAVLGSCLPAAQEGEDGVSFERVLRALREKVAPSVVAVEVDRSADPDGETGTGPVASHRDYYNRPKGVTSGTIVEADGFILTTYFNVSGTLREIAVVLPDGTRHEAALVGFDRSRDIALLKIEAGNLPVLPRASSYRQGDFVALVGRSPDAELATLNQGILSAVSRHNGTAVQMDAELNYGNVGGALVNLRGELIGVASHIRPREAWGQSSGVGFATKVSEVEKVLPRLKKGEKIEKDPQPWIGIQGGEGDPQYEGVQIGQVVPNSPAAKAGLREGDVLHRVGGVKVADVEELRAEILKHKIGDKIVLSVLRKVDGEAERKEEKIEVTLEANPN